ncbi:hypothetical protein FGO68_gene4520 [Halteria grandinella]|uniref:Uncharacterized protein n=1 Tax=Halteria grandinella TaxID=5974 RepID=A0A8J8P8B5_HALGN|nr:hypothetical protein FGO68_gene4520 [Halteria grandinella]
MGNACCGKRDKTVVTKPEILPQEMELLSMVDKKYISDGGNQKESFLQTIFNQIDHQLGENAESSVVCLQMEKKRVRTFIGHLYQVLRKVKESTGAVFIMTNVQAIKVSSNQSETSQDTTIDEGLQAEDEVIIILRDAQKQNRVQVDQYIDEQQAAKGVVIKSMTFQNASTDENKIQLEEYLKSEQQLSLLGGYQSKGRQNQLELIFFQSSTKQQLTVEPLNQSETSPEDLEMVLNQSLVDNQLSFNSLLAYEDSYQKTWFAVYEKSTSEKLFMATQIKNHELTLFQMRRSVNGSLSGSRKSTPRPPSIQELKKEVNRAMLIGEYLQSEERKHGSSLVDMIFPTPDLSVLIYSQ